MANIGYAIRRQMDLGAEFTWLPVETPSVRMNITHIDAVAQFRPWASSGFFFKGGAGMAFVRNWVEVTSPSSIDSKALPSSSAPGGSSNLGVGSVSSFLRRSTLRRLVTCRPTRDRSQTSWATPGRSAQLS